MKKILIASLFGFIGIASAIKSDSVIGKALS